MRSPGIFSFKVLESPGKVMEFCSIRSVATLHKGSSYNSRAVHRPSSKPLSVQFSPDMTQSSNVDLSSFANIVDSAVEGQSFIKCDSKALDF